MREVFLMAFALGAIFGLALAAALLAWPFGFGGFDGAKR